jgi:hypothetical protein
MKVKKISSILLYFWLPTCCKLGSRLAIYLFIYLFIFLISASKTKNPKIARINRHLAKFRQKRKQKEIRPCSGEGARRGRERALDRSQVFLFVQNSCFLI